MLPMDPGELAPLEWVEDPKASDCADLETWSHLAVDLLRDEPL